MLVAEDFEARNILSLFRRLMNRPRRRLFRCHLGVLDGEHAVPKVALPNIELHTIIPPAAHQDSP